MYHTESKESEYCREKYRGVARHMIAKMKNLKCPDSLLARTYVFSLGSFLPRSKSTDGVDAADKYLKRTRS